MQINAQTPSTVPPRIDDHDAQIHAVVSPMKELLGFRRVERVVMHAGTVNPQAPFSAQRIVAGQDDRRIIIANERLHDQLGQKFPKLVNIPNRATEEALIVSCPPKVGPVLISWYGIMA
ncbi:MAG: hypothetical protein R3E01_10140 [Pirellulaceae bacterium]